MAFNLTFNNADPLVADQHVQAHVAQLALQGIADARKMEADAGAKSARAKQAVSKANLKRKFEDGMDVNAHKLQASMVALQSASKSLGAKLHDPALRPLCHFVNARKERCAQWQSCCPVDGISIDADADHDAVYCSRHRKMILDQDLYEEQHYVINEAINAHLGVGPKPIAVKASPNQFAPFAAFDQALLKVGKQLAVKAEAKPAVKREAKAKLLDVESNDDVEIYDADDNMEVEEVSTSTEITKMLQKQSI